MKLTTKQLMAHLDALIRGVRTCDSFEGSITYMIADEKDMWEVSGSYRIGNQQGQGGVCLIEPTPPIHREVICRSCGARYRRRDGCPNDCNDESYG